MQDYLQQLNDNQRKAVEYTSGPQLVIAGAGSGKTRVLTYKIVHLINLGYEPWRIMALTFTNKAAREMRERIAALVTPDQARQLWMGTFHSIFSRLLRINAERLGYRHDYTIYDQSDSLSLIKQVIKDLGLDDKTYKPSSVQYRISMLKNDMVGDRDYLGNPRWQNEDVQDGHPRMGEIYSMYGERCRKANAMDFDDLLYNMNLLLRDCPDLREKYQNHFSYILVDEYQDTNFAQHLIIKQLLNPEQRMCVVGDDAQSIYSFRGANINNILGLKQQYKGLEVFMLDQNYRSTQNILDVANSLIAKNKHQFKKNIFSDNGRGSKVRVIGCASDYEESYVIANTIMSLKRQQGSSWADFAVLYRTNAQSRVIERALTSGGLKDAHGNTRAGIPYRIYGGLAFYQRKEVKDAICYLRMALNPDDTEALKRVINYPARGIGATTVGKIHDAAVAAGVSDWQVVSDPAGFGVKVNKGTLAKLQGFANLINGFIAKNLDESQNAYDTARHIIEGSQIPLVLASDNTPENISRQENINELLRSVRDFVDQKMEEGDDGIRLANYMAEVALQTDQDQTDDQGPCVTLMTAHAAKGLEFENVIIAGVEEDRFPSYRSKDRLEDIEEERRLLYVAITRAKRTCTIMHSDAIVLNGQTQPANPSRFLRDIDAQLLDVSSTSFQPAKPEPESWSSARNSWSAPARQSAMRVTPPPATMRRPASKPATTAPAGNFVTLTADDLHVGSRVAHNRFGHGEVVTIDTAADAKVVVNFENVGLKTLLLKFAKFQLIE